jgi:drug/metabolite transporter (DMT)-like permease
VVFTIIVGLLFRQMPRWNNIISFLLIVAAVYFTFNFEK